jgi:hypothetical protein
VKIALDEAANSAGGGLIVGGGGLTKYMPVGPEPESGLAKAAGYVGLTIAFAEWKGLELRMINGASVAVTRRKQRMSVSSFRGGRCC